MKEWVVSHKDVLAVVISIIALCGTWIPFWWRDLREHSRVDAVIMNFWAEDNGIVTTDIVYVNKGNRPAAITDLVVSIKLRPDPNADPNDIRFKGEMTTWRGAPPPFTLLPGQIATQSYKVGEGNIELNKMGPANAVLDYFLNFSVIDSAGGFHSIRTLMASKTIGRNDFFNSEKKFPLLEQLLPSPKAESVLRLPRKLVDAEKQ